MRETRSLNTKAKTFGWLAFAALFVWGGAGHAQNFGGVGSGRSEFGLNSQAWEKGERPIGNPSPQLLVRIEYPSRLSPEAIAGLVRNVREHEPLAVRSSDDEIAARMIDEINKSTFYAARLYRILSTKAGLPPESVVLAPVDIEAPAEPGASVSTKSPSGEVPAILTIRLATLRAGVGDVTTLATGGIDIRSNTFGKYVTPRAIIVTELAAWPGSAGNVAFIGQSADSFPAATCDPAACTFPGPDVGALLQYFTLSNTKGGIRKIDSSLSSVPYPFGIRAPDTPTTCSTVVQPEVQICSHENVVMHIVRSALGQADPYLATRFQWKDFIDRYDPYLAARWPGAVDAKVDTARLTLIKRMMRAERSILVKVSDKLANDILDGGAGLAMRKQLSDEISYGDAVASISKPRLDLSAVIGIATSLANFGSAFSSRDFTGEINAINSEISRADKISQVQINGLNKTDALHRQQSENFLSTIAVDNSASRDLGAGAQNQTVVELQSRLKKIYAQASLGVNTQPPSECRTLVESTGMTSNFNGYCNPNLQFDSRFGRGANILHDDKTGIFTSVTEHAGALTIVTDQTSYCGAVVCLAAKYFTNSLPTSTRVGVRYVLETSEGYVMRSESFEGISYKLAADGKILSATRGQVAALDEAIRSWRASSLSLVE